MAHLARLSSALVLCGLAACGGKSFEAGEPDPTPGGSSQGGSGSVAGKNAGGSTSRGGTTGKAGSGPGGTGQGGGGDACESYDDQPGYYVNVAIVNKTSVPIHLGQEMVTCGVSPLFDVKDANGVLLAPPGDCRTGCAQARTGGPIGCPAFCAYPSAVTVQPGDVYYTRYDGLYEVPTTLPKACVNPMFGDTQCIQARQIQPGSFTFSSRAGTVLDCSATTGMCSGCDATGNGGCTTTGGLIGGQMRNATTTVQLDASYGVFGSYPAPAPAFPGEPEPDAPSGAMALLTVQLVFND